jgi:exopolyphosphatase / guanosine-5'-triphosphate,3'-diphosphate pyrophosphatase
VTNIPRWEWRTFGESFGPAEERLAAMTPDKVQESDETYLLSTQSDASVKIRDGLMDVKHLEAVNDDGLEQWLPVMKGEFPLSAADAASVLAELGMPTMQLDRETYALDQLVGEVLSQRPELRAVDVSKRRTHFTVGGAMTELSDLTVDGRPTRTIAIELTDPAVVIAAVRELGLADRPNTCMARGLKALAGLG